MLCYVMLCYVMLCYARASLTVEHGANRVFGRPHKARRTGIGSDSPRVPGSRRTLRWAVVGGKDSVEGGGGGGFGQSLRLPGGDGGGFAKPPPLPGGEGGGITIRTVFLGPRVTTPHRKTEIIAGLRPGLVNHINGRLRRP